MGRILPRQAYATYGGQFPRSRAATPIDAIVPWGLVGWWTMDVEDVNFAAGTVVDRSGNGFVGTLTNGPTAIIGQIGQALNFASGSPQYIKMGTNVGQFAGPFTYAAWVNATTNTNTPSVMSSGYNGSVIQSLSINQSGGVATKMELQIYNGTQHLAASTAAVAIGIWEHWVGTCDGVALKLYRNGKLDAVTTDSVLPTATGLNFCIGCLSNNGSFTNNNAWNGGIDDVRIYNRALDQGEILQLYSAGLAGMGYWSGLGLLAPAPATSNLAPQRTLVGVGT